MNLVSFNLSLDNMLKALMQELYREWELEIPPIEESPGVYKIPLEKDLFFTLTTLPQGGIYLFSQIAPLGSQAEEPLLSKALEANLFGQGTHGSFLGLNENGTLLTLSQLIDYDFNSKDFKNIVEDFINAIDFWREEAKKDTVGKD